MKFVGVDKSVFSCPRLCPTHHHLACHQECQASDNLWVCLICGSVLCGSRHGDHVRSHYTGTLHAYALEIGAKLRHEGCCRQLMKTSLSTVLHANVHEIFWRMYLDEILRVLNLCSKTPKRMLLVSKCYQRTVEMEYDQSQDRNDLVYMSRMCCVSRQRGL